MQARGPAHTNQCVRASWGTRLTLTPYVSRMHAHVCAATIPHMPTGLSVCASARLSTYGPRRICMCALLAHPAVPQVGRRLHGRAVLKAQQLRRIVHLAQVARQQAGCANGSDDLCLVLDIAVAQRKQCVPASQAGQTECCTRCTCVCVYLCYSAPPAAMPCTGNRAAEAAAGETCPAQAHPRVDAESAAAAALPGGSHRGAAGALPQALHHQHAFDPLTNIPLANIVRARLRLAT